MGFGSNGIKTTYSAAVDADGFLLLQRFGRCRSSWFTQPISFQFQQWKPATKHCNRFLKLKNSGWSSCVDLPGSISIRICKQGQGIHHVADLCLRWTQSQSRPIAKQASNRSRAKRRKEQNKATDARVELRTINETINVEGLDEEARNAALKKRAKLQRAIKSGETQATKYVPGHFHELLADT